MATVYTLLLVPKFRAFDLTGAPLAGGKVYVYEAGTSSRKESYTSASLDVANAWPVILDANGEADIWVSGPYKIIVTDDEGVQQYSRDDLYGFGGSYASMPEQDPGKVPAWGNSDGELVNSTLTIANIEAAVNAFNTITMLEGGVVAAAAGDASAGVLDDKLEVSGNITKTVQTDGGGVKSLLLGVEEPTGSSLYLYENYAGF